MIGFVQFTQGTLTGMLSGLIHSICAKFYENHRAFSADGLYGEFLRPKEMFTIRHFHDTLYSMFIK